MLKDCTDLVIINKLLEHFDTKVNEITSTYKIMELDDKIIGFINYQILCDEAELYYIYIDSNYRLKGLGSTLLNTMINDLMDHQVNKIFLEVRISNVKAIEFYTKHNFNIINLRKNYYKSFENNGLEDALIMERKIGD